MKALLILTLFIAGCNYHSIPQTEPVKDNDILILSILLQEYVKKTWESEINLEELLKLDTLNRITNSFEKVELKHQKGHMSVFFKFSKSRHLQGIELDEEEKARTGYIRWTESNLKNEYDGEIRLDFGERSYRVIKIVRNKVS